MLSALICYRTGSWSSTRDRQSGRTNLRGRHSKRSVGMPSVLSEFWRSVPSLRTVLPNVGCLAASVDTSERSADVTQVGKLMLNLQHCNYSWGHLKRLVLTGGLITLALVVLSFPFPLPLISTILLLTSQYYIYIRDACTEPVGCVVYPHCGLPNSVLMACFQLHLG